MDGESVLLRAKRVTCQVIEGEAVLVDTHTGSCYSLNKVGTQFWEMLDGRKTIGEHAQSISEQYEVERPIVESDLMELAQKMEADALVEEIGKRGSG